MHWLCFKCMIWVSAADYCDQCLEDAPDWYLRNESKTEPESKEKREIEWYRAKMIGRKK